MMATVVLAILDGTHAEGEEFCQSRPWKGA
jgi:hypothetical protein